jgi:hypothetical protein
MKPVYCYIVKYYSDGIIDDIIYFDMKFIDWNACIQYYDSHLLALSDFTHIIKKEHYEILDITTIKDAKRILALKQL